MFEGKTLLGVGCSHVFAPLGEDFDPSTCHQRSWVKKLEKLAGFSDSVNLGAPGGSNQRSERVVMDYLSNNDYSNLVIMFGITDISRFELLVTNSVYGFEYTTKPIGPWSVHKEHTPDSRELSFVETLYGKFHNFNYEIQLLNRRILHLKTFLDKLNIEHYFVELQCQGGNIIPSQFGIDLPLIVFKDNSGQPTNAIRYIMEQGIAHDYTYHFDHDGHEFLAQLFYDQIKKIKIDRK